MVNGVYGPEKEILASPPHQGLQHTDKPFKKNHLLPLFALFADLTDSTGFQISSHPGSLGSAQGFMPFRALLLP
jgi:hypothetical protein